MGVLDMKCCINCAAFAWWDGDFCCVKKMRILQPSENGKMSKELLTALSANKDCEEWEENVGENIYLEQFINELKEK